VLIPGAWLYRHAAGGAPWIHPGEEGGSPDVDLCWLPGFCCLIGTRAFQQAQREGCCPVSVEKPVTSLEASTQGEGGFPSGSKLRRVLLPV
jgi:hypothetical protein